MRQQALEIELREDCIFSASAATEGAHESIDRVPGSALLGAAASRLYRELGQQDAWLVFHSGKFRFSDGLPLHGIEVGYPVPHAWHYAKAESPERDGFLQTDKLFNFSQKAKQEITQANSSKAMPKQLRKGYVHADGKWTQPKHALRMKTAIDSSTNRAAEGQLFGYDSLSRGQHFIASIEADDDVDGKLFKRVIDALTGNTLLGRSRSAEYGAVYINTSDISFPDVGEIDKDRVVVWVISDMALCDSNGEPTLVPDADVLGLDGAKFDAASSFIRTRHYSPWNAARHGYDSERVVLAAGSVLSFKLDQEVTLAQLEQLQQGVGLYREAGLGRVWVNAPLLMTDQPVFSPVEKNAPTENVTRPEHPLVQWLMAAVNDWRQQADDDAQKLAKDYVQLVHRAREASGVDTKQSYGPSRSQWGNILDIARNKQGNDLFAALFKGDGAVIKPSAEGWNIDIPPTRSEDKWCKLAEAMQKALQVDNWSEQAYAYLVRRLAHRVKDNIDNRKV